MRKGNKILLVILLLLSFSLVGSGVYLLFFKNHDAFERQDTEQDLADDYINDLISQLEGPTEEEVVPTQPSLEPAVETTAGFEELEIVETLAPATNADGSNVTVTDAAGYTYVAGVDSEGRTVAAATDADGSIVPAATDEEGVIVTEPNEEGIMVPSPAVSTRNPGSVITKVEIDVTKREITSSDGLTTSEARVYGKTIRIRRTTSRLDYEQYTDDNYYTRDGVTYTPEYASGVIDCVLEVPSVKIRRGVYTGTWEDILHDLDIWMVTVAHPDYVLGETRYCIYGHNHTVQNLSFNQLQKVQEGEYFYLTAKSGRYTYEITKVFAVAREDATTDYVNNESIGSDKCYLITCGRNDGTRNYRYLDLVVEGTLVKHQTIAEYAKELQQ